MNDIAKMESDDKVQTLSDISEKFVKSDNIPRGFFILPTSCGNSSDCLYIVKIDTDSSPPQLSHVVKINNDLTFSAFRRGAEVAINA